ncbi:unnamed protein product [Staurois parvus]|uniref:Uncharacterized protein n=1 Tax=Staurois parvus TaxID=386267 RepID=A0ABN9D7G4_9NEOB|nr:unnamed protein product [Staurois parvus]
MYINGRPGAVPKRVAIYKWPPHSLHSLPRTQQNTNHCMGPLYEVPIPVIPAWPISDHMNSSKQDVTSDIIAYYV